MDTQAAYQESIDYLYARLPMFSRIGRAAIRNSLDNIIALCKALGDPQDRFKTIHIAGTNGKGSTSHMLAAVLQQAGYRVGLYTSPHLADFRERIRINGKPVSREWVTAFVREHKELIARIEPSFFEITVAMAFQAFESEAVDIAVIETGLGGRLDSTNIITPLLSIITNISYDHKDLLGNTLKEIAAEKAGIIKAGVPVLIGEQQEETARVFFETALRRQSTIYYAEALWDLVRVKQTEGYQHFKAVDKARREMYDLKTDLLGHYQLQNIRTVLAAREVLVASQGLAIGLEQTFEALGRVKALSGLRGRWEQLGTGPVVIADVAHNAAGLKEVLEQWREVKAERKFMVTGFVRDKDIAEALAFFPRDCRYFFCNAGVPRALPAGELCSLAQAAGLAGDAYGSVAAAVEAVRELMTARDALLICGSFFVVGEALECFATEEALQDQT